MRGDRVKERREALHLTQKELAETLKVSENTVIRIEKGRDPAVATLRLLAELFGVSVDWLLGMTSQPTHIRGEDELSAQERFVLFKFRQNREAVEQLIRAAELMAAGLGFGSAENSGGDGVQDKTVVNGTLETVRQGAESRK